MSPVLNDWRCPTCGQVSRNVALASGVRARCPRCLDEMRSLWDHGQAPTTDVFGHPRYFDCSGQEHGSRRDLVSHMRSLGYEEAGDRVRGGRTNGAYRKERRPFKRVPIRRHAESTP